MEGEGHSGFIHTKNFIEIQHSDDFSPDLFSITFWFYLIEGFEGIYSD